MKKESKNWVIIPKRSVIRYGKIARRQREDYKLDRNSAALIKCEECDTSVKDNEEEYKKMNHFFKKGSSRKRREWCLFFSHSNWILLLRLSKPEAENLVQLKGNL